MNLATLPGPGDTATFPPCLNHPNDPRTPPARELAAEAAVFIVAGCLAGDRERAFGEDREWWCEVLMDELASVQANVLLAILQRDECPSIGADLRALLAPVVREKAMKLLSTGHA